jgi:hypothetical protein
VEKKNKWMNSLFKKVV